MIANPREMTIFQLFYVSRAREWIDVSEVRNILTIAQRNNQNFDVTGCLLFSGRYFFQILEGDRADVSDLMRNVMVDRRHTDIRLILGHMILTPQYPQCSMAGLHNPDANTKMEHLLTHKNQVLSSSELLGLMIGNQI